MAALVSRRTPANTSASVELFASIVSSPPRIETRAAVGGSCAGVGGGGGVAGTCACGGGSGCFLPFLFFSDSTAAFVPVGLAGPCFFLIAGDWRGSLPRAIRGGFGGRFAAVW